MPTSRPSTSGGRRAPASAETPSLAPLNRRMSRDDLFLGAQLKRAATWDKRVSRDDMSLGYQPSGAYSAAFHIPLRTQPATISERPEGGLAIPISSDSQIGMALGSPMHSPLPEQSQSNGQRQHQRQIQHQQSHQPAQSTFHAARRPSFPTQDGHLSPQFSGGHIARQDEPAANPANPPAIPISPPGLSMQRSKSTRRKLFGFFGSKRQADHAIPALPVSAPKNSLDASDGSSVVMTSAIASSSSVASQTSQPQTLQAPQASQAPQPSQTSQTSQASASAALPLGRSTTRGRNRKHQPIVIAPESSASIGITASHSATSPPLVDALPAALPAAQPATQPATGFKSSPSIRRPFLRSKAPEPANRKRPPVAPANSSSNNLTTQPILGTSPYLNVEIPEASMERYSIMFGGLLDCGPSASSLLARRQATLDRLKTINGTMHRGDLDNCQPNAAATDAYLQVGQLQRRATSPHYARSPSLSQLPSESSGLSHFQHTLSVNAGHRSPRTRSNTTPVVTHSPMQSEFALHKQPLQPPQRYAHPLRDNPTGLARKMSTTANVGVAVTTMPTSASSISARPAAYFDPDQSSLILDSPTEMASPVGDQWARKEATQEIPGFKPVIQEPQWQMISPPSTGSSNESAASKLKLARDGRDSAETSPVSDISIELQVDEPDSALKSAVEISIARQISISRQQRDMLRPRKTGSAKGGVVAAPSLPRPAPPLKLGRNERLQETKSSTPTLVVAPEPDANYSYSYSGSNHAQSQPQSHHEPQSIHHLSPRSNANGAGSLYAHQLAQNRKSERVVLEAA